MNLFKALEEHGEARRPYHIAEMNKPSAKFVCTIDGYYFWLEWADTGIWVRRLEPNEVSNYTRGYDDWNLI